MSGPDSEGVTVGNTPRWRAVVEYQTEDGVLDVQHEFEEIEELHRLIERGPNWESLIRCTITRNDDIAAPQPLPRASIVEFPRRGDA